MPKSYGKIDTEKDQKNILDKVTLNFINRLWLLYAEKLINEISIICELSPEQKQILEYIHLKPNDFDIEIFT